MSDEVEDTEMLDRLDSTLWGGPGIFKCPEKGNRDDVILKGGVF